MSSEVEFKWRDSEERHGEENVGIKDLKMDSAKTTGRLLSAEEIERHIVGKVFLGSFPPAFKYIVSINDNGSLEGKNNYQHYDTGEWSIDAETNTLSVKWSNGWEASTNKVYLTGGVVTMFCASSGKLNTSFDEQLQGVESIKLFEIG